MERTLIAHFLPRTRLSRLRLLSFTSSHAGPSPSSCTHAPAMWVHRSPFARAPAEGPSRWLRALVLSTILYKQSFLSFLFYKQELLWTRVLVFIYSANTSEAVVCCANYESAAGFTPTPRTVIPCPGALPWSSPSTQHLPPGHGLCLPLSVEAEPPTPGQVSLADAWVGTHGSLHVCPRLQAKRKVVFSRHTPPIRPGAFHSCRTGVRSDVTTEAAQGLSNTCRARRTPLHISSTWSSQQG